MNSALNLWNCNEEDYLGVEHGRKMGTMALTDDDKRWIVEILDAKVERLEAALRKAVPAEERHQRISDSLGALEEDANALAKRVEELGRIAKL